MQINILITSAGRRCELIDIWKSCIDFLGADVNLTIYTGDKNPTLAPACYLSDHSIKLLDCNDPGYITDLLEQCTAKNIMLIIPTIDPELEILSCSKELFLQNGIHVVASEPSFIQTCADKANTIQLFDNLCLAYPKIYDKSNIRYPCIIKPRRGSSSSGVRVLRSESDMPSDFWNDKYLAQQLVPSGWTEYSIDAYYSRNSLLLDAVPRRRIKTRGGEILQGLVYTKSFLDPWLSTLRSLPGASGPLTIQLFTNEQESEFLFIEINPRFGGGYPMSHFSGANFPAMLIQEYFLHCLPKPQVWNENQLFLRFDHTLKVNPLDQ